MNEFSGQADGQNAVASRVGVILCDLGKLNVAALKYLIVHLNTLQGSFEFELLTMDSGDPLLTLLRPKENVDRDRCRKMLPEFHDRAIEYITREQQGYELVDMSTPHGFVLITMAHFSDEHYGLNLKCQDIGNTEKCHDIGYTFTICRFARGYERSP